MAYDMEAVEAVRTCYRPNRITTLFVGESAPHSGDFFYRGNTAMLQHMRHAVESAFGKSGDFLQTFKAYGWYLDDLVLTPVNKLSRSERKAKCLEARQSRADRIKIYQPEAIVSLLISIEPLVDEAATIAGSNASRYAVPFPGVGHQGPFQAAMARISRNCRASNLDKGTRTRPSADAFRHGSRPNIPFFVGLPMAVAPGVGMMPSGLSRGVPMVP